MPTQFRGLRAFCEAARTGSFKSAADELCVTASAISHQIRALEDYLGAELFERKTRAIELTATGQNYYRRIAPLLAGIDTATQELRCGSSKTVLRLQMPDFFASELFIPRMSEFSSCYPDVDLRIDALPPGSTPERVNGDIVVMLTGREPEFASVRKLFAVRYVPACSVDQFAQLSQAGSAALEASTLLVHKARPRAWDRWAREAGVRPPAPKQIIRLDSMHALARATEQGVGIGLIPLPVSANWFRDGKLKRLFATDLVTRDYYCVAATGTSRHPDAARLLWEWIVQQFGQPLTSTS